MDCEIAWGLLSGRIDGQNTPQEDAALDAHLSECPQCRAALDQLLAAECCLNTMEVEAPPQLKTNIMQAIAAEAAAKPRTTQKQPRRWLRAASGFGAVAAVLAVLLISGAVKLPQLGRDAAKPEAVQAGNDAWMDAYDGEKAMPDPEMALEAAPIESETVDETAAFFGYAGAAEEDAENFATDSAAADNQITTSMLEAPWHSFLEVETPASSSGPILRGAARSDADREQFYDLCRLWSAEQEAPVLVLSGAEEDFPAFVEKVFPELGARLTEAECLEENGKRLYVLDSETALALAEWLRLFLPEQDLTQLDPQTAQERLDGCDPYAGYLQRFTSLPNAADLTGLQRVFASLFGEDCTWSLFFPTDDFTPEDDARAYLVVFTD